MADDDGRTRVRGGLELKPARIADAARIALLSREVIEAGLPWAWTPRVIARTILDPETEVVVARIDGHLVGFGAMRFGDEDAHLLLLGVAAPYQRRGIGARLIAYLEKCARTAGIQQIHLQVRAGNWPGRRFYRRLGYRETSIVRGYYQRVEDAVLMTQTL